MGKIKMVDLKGQYENIKPEIDKAIQSVINSTAFIRGPEVAAFEEELADYLGVKHVISCANGTDALQLAIMSLGLKPGDEIITSNFTFIATVEVIALLGLKPVFVEPDPQSFNISATEIEKNINPNTKAIMPVHLFGQCSDMIAIKEIADRHKLFIIEDSAQASGADFIYPDGRRKKAGTIGDLGCTSFFPSKNLACFGDGGAVFTDNDDLAILIRSMANHGMTKKYYHDNIGINSRLDAIQAAILRVKLRYLDSYNQARQKAASYYDRVLADTSQIIRPARFSYSTHIFHQYTIKTSPESRDELKTYLELNNIPAMIYYPVPLHKQEAYAYLGLRDKDFGITGKLTTEVLSLPMHTELKDEELVYIAERINEFYK